MLSRAFSFAARFAPKLLLALALVVAIQAACVPASYAAGAHSNAPLGVQPATAFTDHSKQVPRLFGEVQPLRMKLVRSTLKNNSASGIELYTERLDDTLSDLSGGLTQASPRRKKQ